MNQPDKIKNRIDFKTLTATLAIQTKSRDDKAMLSFIREKLGTMNVTVQEDGYGNIYVTKGEADVYPCVVAHTDSVHDVLKDVNIFRTGDTLFAFDPIKRTQCGIGGDDKVGVYITLQLLEDIPTLKAVFFRDEEIGCLGSSYSIKHHKEWYNNCGYVLMADRRDNRDLITVSGGIVITSDEFLESCEELIAKYEYKEVVGIYTDVDTLASGGIGISCVNLSCGYFNPHTSREIVSISDVNTCYNFMYDIITKHTNRKFAYEAKIPEYRSSFSRKGINARTSMFNLVNETGPASPVAQRQLKMHLPEIYGYASRERYDLFIENDVIKGKYKIYNYIGTKTLPLTGDSKCKTCKGESSEHVRFLPYEGRMYCTNCNDYVPDPLVPKLLKELEVESNDIAFVYSLYSAGWLRKDQSKWNEKLNSWVSTQVPF